MDTLGKDGLDSDFQLLTPVDSSSGSTQGSDNGLAFSKLSK
jgi:hypothetical protein